LADAHRLVVEGLISLLSPSCDIVDTVEDGRALVDAVNRLDPDIVVGDISLPVLSGIDALAQLKKRRARAMFIVLTMHRDAAYAIRALEAGASGFVLKHSASSELLAAIRDALAGKRYVTPLLPPDIVDRSRRSLGARGRDPEFGLTPRQREVLRLVAEGRSAKEIGAALNISRRTVESYRHKIKDDLHLRNTAEMVQFAIKHGISPTVVRGDGAGRAAIN
jgi:DNA-binding NarL/FixJ family response regulator